MLYYGGGVCGQLSLFLRGTMFYFAFIICIGIGVASGLQNG
jgi:hypothetical protein